MIARPPAIRLATLLALALLLAPAPAGAQRVRLASDAEVASVNFRFAGRHALEADELSGKIATQAPQFTDELMSWVAWVPYLPPPARHPFDPLVLQEDVVRLRNHYRRQGFLAAHVDYTLKTDENRHRVDVTFTIDEGPPLIVRSVALADSLRRTGAAIADSLGALLSPEWGRLEKAATGVRLSEEDVTAVAAGLAHALEDRGYLFARVEPVVAIDSLAHEADLVWSVHSGERVRIGAVEVGGVTKVKESVVTREIPLEAGDWASRKDLEKGRANVQSIPLFRRADVVVPVDGDRDAVPLRVTVQESGPRFTNLEIGYVTDGAGITGQARWTHPNFTGGARSLDAIVLGQSGWFTTSDVPDRLLRISLPLNQPYIFSSATTLSVGPSYEYRDGRIDRSTSQSITATLVRRFNPLQSAALRYDFTYRRLYQLRLASVDEGQTVNVTALAYGTQALVDSLTQPVRISQVVFFTNAGSLDDLSKPRHGFVLKPNLSVTVPPAWGNVEFGRMDMQGTWFMPAPGRQNALMLRGTLGGVWPFGKSVPPAGAPSAASWLRLEDQLLNAGGATDVRGYESRLLGPKFPNIEATVTNGDTVYSSSFYIPVGGLRRYTATAELRIAPPNAPKNVFVHLFADAGRVWTSDPRFHIRLAREDDDRTFYTTGGGLGYYTPVGAIRFDLGYKMNPSAYDLRHPNDVLQAVIAGGVPDDAPVDHRLRWVFHLALGLFF